MKIGLFDSGVGGLSVLKAIEEHLPHQECIYFADQMNFPYGEKQPHEIMQYAQRITTFLVSKNIELLIIACNTASVYSLDKLRNQFHIPILGMIEPAVQAIQNDAKVISILATSRTISSNIYQKKIAKSFPNAKIVPIACPNLASLIEESKDIRDHLEEYLKPTKGHAIDALILGCTHYAFVEKQFQEILDPDIKIIDPAKEVAKKIVGQLMERQNPKQTVSHIFYVSGDSSRFSEFLHKHLPKSNFEMHFFQQNA